MLQSQLGETNMRQSRLNKELRDANTREFVKGSLGCKRGRVNSKTSGEQTCVSELEMQLEFFRPRRRNYKIGSKRRSRRKDIGRLTKADAEVKLRSEIASLSGDVETLKGELESTRSELAKKDEKIVQLRSDLNETSVRIKTSEDEIMNLEMKPVLLRESRTIGSGVFNRKHKN